MKFLISASVISVMVFYSSLLPFLHSLNLYVSATIHKNYMFLLCNGLLVFIVRNSGLISNSHLPQEQSLKISDRHEQSVKTKVEDEKERESELYTEVADEENESNKETESELFTEVADEEKGLISVEEEEDDDDDGEIGILSKDELNRKCEEFIRKMKAGIKFESQVLVL